jgi:hypothetical protein
VPADDLAAYIASLHNRLRTGELRGRRLVLGDGGVIEDGEAAVRRMLEDFDEYRALPRAERGQEPWRPFRQAPARELLRLREVLP